MTTLVIVEHDNQAMHPATHSAFAAALQLDSKPMLLVVGYQCQAVAKEAATLAGASLVLLADNPCYNHQLAENVSQLIVSIADCFNTMMMASTTFAKNLMPAVAARLNVAQISDVSRIVDADTFEHPIFAGNAVETVRSLDAKKILTIRTTAFTYRKTLQDACDIKKIDTVIHATLTHFIGHELTPSTRPNLSNATIVVAGGRGLQSMEKFKLIEKLADTLGAAIGASRAAVDAGFVPNEYQVGQTGRVVAPELYIAIGISGAVQHLAGMKDSKIIVAINNDVDAPIFKIATYGLVGDLFILIPQLIEQLILHKTLDS